MTTVSWPSYATDGVVIPDCDADTAAAIKAIFFCALSFFFGGFFGVDSPHPPSPLQVISTLCGC